MVRVLACLALALLAACASAPPRRRARQSESVSRFLARVIPT